MGAGGAIVLDGTDFSIENCLLINNAASGFSDGGAATLYRSTVTIKNCTFSQNTGDVNGEGPVESSISTVSIVDSIPIEAAL